ncbi:DMT family transporter [Falsiroseomonas stagni]|uniref:EamA-like transporter family protein n=1 Tax=Falsiroseomonas stagni DSM 19981 TaxID=1123062 RepID=A0A1I3YG13_9PROT|nr:DMT family transporter [Falsiroseomonas stagni]SFK30762.1 EamA-like transporter family protein [Falsiroseomonas stagni DSM 19981]
MEASSPEARRERRIGYACAFAVLFLWVGFLLTARLSARQALTPWDTAALRHAGAFLAAVPLVAVLGWPRLGGARLLVVLGTAAFGFPLAAYVALGFAPVAHAGVFMTGMLPFFTAALGFWLLGEAWTRRRFASLGIVAAGILLLAIGTFGDQPGTWRGDLLFLCGSLSWAIYTTAIRRWRISAVEGTMAVALWAGPVYLPIWWLALPSSLHAAPWGVIGFQMLFQGVFAVLVAGFLFTRAVTAIGPGRTTTITSLVPGMAALAAWPLLGEPLNAAALSGVALVTAGMVIGVLQPTPVARAR